MFQVEICLFNMLPLLFFYEYTEFLIYRIPKTGHWSW